MFSPRRISAFLLVTVILSLGLVSCAGLPRGVGATDVAPDVFQNLIPIEPDPVLSLPADGDWYKDAVFYHIWVNAFHDSTGNGIGDIRGITLKLDYLQELGVTALWLSPFFRSASQSINLHMYDTIDHYAVDPRFGTVEDVEELIAEAHARDMRLIFDWVPNHVSSSHPWFTESARFDTEKAHWFVWRDSPGALRGPWGQMVWHQRNSRFYYGVFWGGMPDINFWNVHAKDAITNTAIYWLNKGFDGMRIDAVRYLYEDQDETLGRYADLPETIQYFQAIREQILDVYTDLGYSKFMVAENWTDNRASLERYMHDQGRPGFHMTLDFPFATHASGRNAAGLDAHWRWVDNSIHAQGRGWMGTFLSNHDDVVRRPASVQRNEELLKAIVGVQLTGVGTPFLYYGNEIGMPDVPMPSGAGHEDRRHRQPFEWSLVEQQTHDPNSLLNWHRDLGDLRNARESLRRGDYSRIDPQPSPLFAYQRWLADESEGTLVIAQLGTRDLEFTLPVEHIDRLLFSSPGFDPEQGVLASGDFAVYALSSRIPLSSDAIGQPEPKFHLRGSMNGWGATAMDFEGSGDQKTWVMDEAFMLGMGTSIEFKFTYSVDSTSWEDDDTFGFALVEYVHVPGSVELSQDDFTPGNYDNIVLEVPFTAEFRWVILQDKPGTNEPIRWTLMAE